MHEETFATTGAGTGEDRAGRRNRFFRGKQMKVEEFNTEQAYFLGRRRLVNRSVIGPGVVYGFDIDGPRPAAGKAGGTPAPSRVAVKPGFALDQHGREIVVGEPVVLGTKIVFVVVEGASGCQVSSIETMAPGRYVLSIHYAERRVGDAKLQQGCGCTHPEKQFVCETAVFSLKKICGDGCPCAEGPCSRECECGEADSCGNAGRGPHRCLCRWIAKTAPAGDERPLCEWGGYWMDPADGVGLACVDVVKTNDECAPIAITIFDDCSPRRVVKNLELLYDLLRGCDLTRIDWISWEEWHRKEMQWGDFSGQFHPTGDKKEKHVRTEFVVKFSRPILVSSLGLDCVIMTAFTVEGSTGWRIPRRVPITRIEPDSPDASNTTTTAIRLFADAKWVGDETSDDRESWLTERPFTVEIEIRGDLILDCHGQAVDGNARGMTATPSGNGTPGGTYLSTFGVAKRPADPVQ
jgi:hypothetical protein